MKYSAVLLTLATGALAQYSNGTTYETITTTAITTYCPYPTEVVHGSKTYTVTAATTLTITDCPCTITRPVIPASTVLYTSCPPSVAPPPAETHPAPPAKTQPVYTNPLTTYVHPTPVGTASYTPSQPPVFTGAASANKVAGGLMAGAAVVAAMAL